MALEAITLSVDVTSWAAPPIKPSFTHDTLLAETRCAFCGLPTGKYQVQSSSSQQGSGKDTGRVPACALCALPQHLERSRIDDEAALVWLPEMSQQAINAMMREVHIQIRALGEDLQADAIFRHRSPSHRALYYARSVLAERTRPAADRVGTHSAHELGLALLDLSPAAYARRAALLSGLRLMPLGRFFEDDKDIYPEIVDSWRRLAESATPSTHSTKQRLHLGKG